MQFAVSAVCAVRAAGCGRVLCAYVCVECRADVVMCSVVRAEIRSGSII